MRLSVLGRAGAALIVGCVALAIPERSSAATPAASITVLSSRAEVVSGGDALVGVRLPPGVNANILSITVNGADVTAGFRAGPPDHLMGLVTGLRVGDNSITVNGRHLRTTTLVIRNHPITGPVFSGPREQPFYCMTHEFSLPASTQTLGPPLDSDCSVATRVDYVYRTATGEFRPLPAHHTAPADLAQTTTTDGTTVPYIVRVETGTINRAIYQTAVLSNPATEPAVTPFAPPTAWNRRLVYTFGGGCIGGWYAQGHSVGNGGILEDLMLRQGYGVASASLNVYGNNCNDLLAAETVSMVKERFLKTFGPVRFTIGVGCSGGSQQLHPLADAYPGLVDGIIVGCSFPEVLAAQILNQADADLFAHYFTHAGVPWTAEQQSAATGYPNATTAANVGAYAIRVKAQGGTCPESMPAAARFDRATNPDGVRCDIYDHYANVLGRDRRSGAVHRPFDNVGVQYGLAALHDGAISMEQFLDLNRAIGGYDQDGNYAANRSLGEASAIRRLYETGRVTYGGLGLKSTPIIDYRGYVDQPENSNEVHSRVHSFSLRERLLEVNGSFANQVMLVESGLPGTRGQFSDASPVLAHALTQMDEWLSALAALSGPGGLAHPPSLPQIARARPADLEDACYRENGTIRIAEPQVYRGDTTCNRLYPAFSTPRMVAGEPLANNVLKCRLQALHARDYGPALTKRAWQELSSIFPDGVCDYSVPGVSQVSPRGTWRIF